MDPVLIIFIGLSAFVAYRLFSVLGARTGHEQTRDVEGLQRARNTAENHDAPQRARELPPVSAGATALREADPEFDERQFLDGARVAYEMIVEAFAAGDLKSIRRFLSPSVYEAFKAAVSAREEGGRTSELKFVGIDAASIASSEVSENQMIAVTDFSSNQVRVTYDRAGEVVDGDANRIDLVKDRWTFARALGSNDPNWLLIATGGA